jgi:hypothetical protein
MPLRLMDDPFQVGSESATASGVLSATRDDGGHGERHRSRGEGATSGPLPDPHLVLTARQADEDTVLLLP